MIEEHDITGEIENAVDSLEENENATLTIHVHGNKSTINSLVEQISFDEITEGLHEYEIGDDIIEIRITPYGGVRKKIRTGTGPNTWLYTDSNATGELEQIMENERNVVIRLDSVNPIDIGRDD